MATRGAVPLRSPRTVTAIGAAGRASHVARVALHAWGNGVLVTAIAVSALLAVEFDFGVPRLLVALVMGFLGFAAVSAGEGFVVLLWTVIQAVLVRGRFARALTAWRAVPPVPIGRILGAFAYVAGDLLWPQSFFKHLALPAVGELAIVLAGPTTAAIALARLEGRTRLGQAALLAPPVAAIAALVLWVADPGFDDYVVAAPVDSAPSMVALEDPGASGTFAVRTLTYGSGTSLRRPEYGAAADLRTATVDGSRIFGGYEGLARSFHRWYWGFDFGSLPVNGLVWVPEGTGPFPLVVVVHGNHAMSEPSEPGYAYLGEHLASHGYLVAAIDQNFLNGLFFFDGQFAEMPLRAWLVLQHLQQWRTWNETPDHALEGRVDLERVALVGHSRGGEAVAWAAHLNERPMAPISSVSSPDDFGFGIRGVVAIAPSDAFAGPNDRKPAAIDADYLLLAGGHDADTFMLYGQAQYERTRLGDDADRFKALAYVHRANHGQFNAVWGDRDRGTYNSLLLNRAPLLEAAEQQQAAKTLVTSFLHASVLDRSAYGTLFQNPSTGHSWLPEGFVVTRWQDGASIVVEDFDGAGAVPTKTESVADATIETLLQRDGEREQGNRALRLSWNAASRPTYEIALSVDEMARWAPTPVHALTFALAGVPGTTPPFEVTVELLASDGASAGWTLATPVLPALPAHLVKARWLYGRNGFPGTIRPEEVVLQTYTVSLADFDWVDATFEPTRSTGLRFIFAGAEAGAVYLDEVALAPPHDERRRDE